MANVEINVDTSGLEEFSQQIRRTKRRLIGQLAEAGYIFLRREIKETAYETGNLEQGVAEPGIDNQTGEQVTESENRQGKTYVDYENLNAQLVVSARTGRTGSQAAEVISADGKKTKTVTLRPQPGFNYAAAVARGRPSISPKVGKALLIPVSTPPSGQSYLMVGGRPYIVRKSAKAVPPNPFDTRAAARLESRAPRIAEALLDELKEQ